MSVVVILRPRPALTAALAVAALALAACGGGGGGGGDDDDRPDAPDDSFDRRALIEHLATNVLLPGYVAFADDAAALVTAVDAYCDALVAGDAIAERDAARAAWRDAADAWERNDAILVGPAAMDFKALRNRIYAWPLAATCGVDNETVTYWSAPSSYDVAAEFDNVRSLVAVEYLLFTASSQHTCTNPPAGWDALGAELPRARCGLAAAIAADVAAQGAVVRDAWDPASGNYVAQLVEAGTSASSVGSLQEAANLVSDALFYVDTMVKDMKLGEAAGIAVNSCGTIQEPCVREVEHRHADHATAAIRINLRTLREAFTGTTATVDGPGFDDWLSAVGAEDVAARMTGSLDAAIAAADAVPDSFLTALAGDYDAVVALHTAVKAFTDDLKSQFLTVLGLDIPDDVAADND